jgi:hypothetical protein
MDKKDIIILSAVFVFLALRLYQKYVKKDQGKPGNAKSSGTSFTSSEKSDDYEPYSGK